MIVMTTYTVYRSPADYPGRWVVRGHDILTGVDEPVPHVEPLVVCDSLEDARASMPPGLLVCPRDRHDDPCIVETWI